MRIDSPTGVSELGVGAREAAENEGAIFVVLAPNVFFGDKVHAVMDRACDADIGYLIKLRQASPGLCLSDQLNCRARWGPVGFIELISALLKESMKRTVFGELHPAGNGNLEEGDPPSKVWVSLQQARVSLQAFEDSFRVVDSVYSEN